MQVPMRMQRNRLNKTEMNNRGFSLVEILIALAILAIITVPLLHAFVTSAKVNMNARRKLRVTTIAQDIMEGLKADSLEEIRYQFANPDGDADHDGFHLIDKHMIKGTVYEAPTGADGVYQFNLEKVYVENTDEASFPVDIIINITASPYRDATLVDRDTQETAIPEKHNDVFVADISGIDTAVDGFYIEGYEHSATDNNPLVEWAVSTINGYRSASEKITAASIRQKITIRIDNTVNGALSGSADHTVVKVKYEYTTLPENESNHDPKNYCSWDAVMFDNKVSGEPLQSIYLFYHPNYGVSATKYNDLIVYENPGSVPTMAGADPVILRLIKQEMKDNTHENVMEANYRCRVNITDGAGAHSRLQTNIDTNAYSVYNKSYAIKKYAQGTYYYNGTASSKSALSPDSTYTSTDPDFVGKKKLDRIYSVSVDVYKGGSINLSGGMPALSDRYAHIEGSKN